MIVYLLGVISLSVLYALYRIYCNHEIVSPDKITIEHSGHTLTLFLDHRVYITSLSVLCLGLDYTSCIFYTCIIWELMLYGLWDYILECLCMLLLVPYISCDSQDIRIYRNFRYSTIHNICIYIISISLSAFIINQSPYIIYKIFTLFYGFLLTYCVGYFLSEHITNTGIVILVPYLCLSLVFSLSMGFYGLFAVWIAIYATYNRLTPLIHRILDIYNQVYLMVTEELNRGR